MATTPEGPGRYGRGPVLRPIVFWVLVVVIALSVVALVASLVSGDGHTFWSAVRTLVVTTVTAAVIRQSYTATNRDLQAKRDAAAG